MKKLLENDLYPTLDIRSKATVIETDDGCFKWVVTIHELASDVINNKESDVFKNKKDCTHNLIINYMKTLKELYNELEP